MQQGKEDIENIGAAVQDDPAGLIRDFFASDEAQELCRSGDRAGCAGMFAVENGSAFVPGFGWDRKRQRLEELADAADRDKRDRDKDRSGDKDPDDLVQADGDHSEDRGKGDHSKRCPFNSSFVPGTPVLAGDGSLVPIEDVRIGDEVHAFDPVTGAEGPREVTALISSMADRTLVDISVTGGDADTDGGTGLLTATDEHPFWAPELAEWVNAADLQPGTWLRTSAGTWVQVTAISVRPAQDQQVHNLTVDDLHTYYVGAGSAALLVHNENRWASPDCAPESRKYDTDGDGYKRPVGQRANAEALAARAKEIEQGPPKLRNTTVAVVRVYNTRTDEFEIWVTTSNNKGQPFDKKDEYFDNPPSNFNLESHEKFIPGPGHAEEALQEYLRENPDYKIVEGGTNYNVCQGEKSSGNCMPRMEEMDLQTGGDYPGRTYKSKHREFWWGG